MGKDVRIEVVQRGAQYDPESGSYALVESLADGEKVVPLEFGLVYENESGVITYAIVSDIDE
jgi:hypothetical protein